MGKTRYPQEKTPKDNQIVIDENPPIWEDKDFLLMLSCSVFLFCLQSAFNPHGGCWREGENAGLSIKATTHWTMYLAMVVILTICLGFSFGQMLLARKLSFIATSNSRGLIICSIRVVLAILIASYILIITTQVSEEHYYEVNYWMAGSLFLVLEIHLFYLSWSKTCYGLLGLICVLAIAFCIFKFTIGEASFVRLDHWRS